MRGIILSHENGGSYVIDRQGNYHFVKGYANVPVGNEIDWSEKRKPASLPSLIAIAACFLILVFGGVVVYGNSSVAYYVNVDINPSVEIQVNNFNRVKKVSGLNDDGRQLICDLSFSGLHADEAVLLIAQEAKNRGYGPADGQVDLVVSLTSNGRADLASIADTIETALADSGFALGDDITCFEKRDWNQASELGVSPGKLKLAKKLFELDPSVPIEELVEISVQDISKSIKAIKEEIKEAEKAAKEAEKEAEKALKEAEKALKDAEKEAEKALKEAEKALKDAEKEVEKALKEAEKESDKSSKEALKEAEKALKEAEKEAEKALKEAEKALKDAEKALKDAEKQSD